MPRTPPKVNNIVFEQTPEAYYLLGVFYSDGNITKVRNNNYAMAISSNDEDWLLSIRDFYFPESNVRKRKSDDCKTLSIQNQQLANWLLENKCYPNKSKTIQFPKHIPDEFMPDFIRGVFDGDGHIHNQERKYKNQNKIFRYAKISIVSGSKDFIKDLHEYLLSKGINSSFVETIKQKKFKVYYAYIDGNEPIKFINYIYYKKFQKKFCLKRKYERALEAIEIFEQKQDEINKMRIMTEENKTKCIKLREKGYTYEAIEILTKIPKPNFAGYIKGIEIKTKNKITKEDVLNKLKNGLGREYNPLEEPDEYFDEKLKEQEIFFKEIKKSHPLFSKWFLEHYPKSKGVYGKSINFLIYNFGKPVGIIGFNSNIKDYAKVNNFFDIDKSEYEQLLNNNIFRIVDKNKDENFGTKSLSKIRKQIKDLWKAKYGVNIIGLYTFVELPRSGAVYKADNWSYLGETQGAKKIGSGKFLDTDNIKLVFAIKVN